MGNWRTVMIDGTCDPAEVVPLRAWLTFDWRNSAYGEGSQGPLGIGIDGSLFGLNNWIAPKMTVSGNLSERDFTVEDVAEHLREALAVAPSLRVKIHCGGDWESDDCVATITAADGTVTVGSPEREFIVGVTAQQGADRLLGFLARPAKDPE